MTSAVRSERGFALPAVIFLVALLTLLLTSGLSRVTVDRQIAEASEATVDAFTIAQSGLQNYIGTRTARPPDNDSVRINVPGGYANVIARVIQNPADTMKNELYLVRSTGVVINPLAGAVPQATRTVAQFANWQAGWMVRRAAITAANGLTFGSGGDSVARIMNGNDECGLEPAIPGARSNNIPLGGYPPGAIYLGTPPYVDDGSNGATIANQTGIDWATLISSNFVPDYNSFQYNDMTFPVQRVLGSLQLGSGGRGSGLLIVRDDFDPTGLGTGFYFQGVILVGGTITFNADSNVVHGLVVSGLKNQLFGYGTDTKLGDEREHVKIYFNSCYVNQALASLRGMTPVGNAWLDIWAGF